MRFDFKPAGCEDNGKREPEPAVRRERSCTEGVSNGHFPARTWSALSLRALAPNPGSENIPHACKQLYQASVSKCKTNHYVGRTQTSRTHVDQAQDERGQGESAQAQRRRVGETTVFDLLVKARLELSSKGRQALFATARVDVGKRTVAEASGSFGGLMFLVGHLSVGTTAAVGLFVVSVGAVACEGSVGLSGHCDGEEIFEGARSVEVDVGLAGGRNRLSSMEMTGRTAICSNFRGQLNARFIWRGSGKE